MKTYPRVQVRVNARGKYDAYLIRSRRGLPIWVSVGNTIHEALWWVRPPATPAHNGSVGP